MEIRKQLQKINIADNLAVCTGCSRNILDISNMKFIRNSATGPRFQEELYACRECGTEFIIRYDLFDSEGHIHQRIFTDDPNDPKYNWPDILTPEQRKEIGDHLKSCNICNDRLYDQLEGDVWFANFLHNKKGSL